MAAGCLSIDCGLVAYVERTLNWTNGAATSLPVTGYAAGTDISLSVGWSFSTATVVSCPEESPAQHCWPWSEKLGGTV